MGGFACRNVELGEHLSDYPAGSWKCDPNTWAIAVRTVFPETGALADHAWLVATTSIVTAKTSADVASWIDVPHPVLPEPTTSPAPAETDLPPGQARSTI